MVFVVFAERNRRGKERKGEWELCVEEDGEGESNEEGEGGFLWVFSGRDRLRVGG